MKSSTIVLAGGFSKRFGEDKGLIDLGGKPLILHVVDTVSEVTGEVLVVVGSRVQKKKFESLLGQKATVFVDKQEVQSPLVGALTGFEFSQGEYSLLLSCDTPFISIRIARFLLENCINNGAAIPRWPNGYIEPLHAAYHTRSAFAAAKMALEQGKLNLRSMIAGLNGVRYISTVVLQQMDLKLLTFLNINTPEALQRAEALLKQPAAYKDADH